MTLTTPERHELERRVASRRGRADEARRARCILLVTEGTSWAAIRAQLDCSDSYIARWTGRFTAERLAGLYSRHRGQPATTLTPRLEARILEATRRGPGGGTTHWSTRRLGKHLGLSHMMVARVWAKHALKPHRLERYMASDDPDFERKAADVIGLYLNPPQHAAGSASMRRPPFRRSIGSIPSCRCPRGVPSAMARVPSPRDALPLRRLQHPHRRGAGQDGRAPHLGRVRGLPGRPGGPSTEAAGTACDLGESVRA